MLPSSKNSLQRGGSSPRAAAWTLIACFLAGVFGIQIFSKILHHFLPSHTIDCDHSHSDEHETEERSEGDTSKQKFISAKSGAKVLEDAPEQSAINTNGHASVGERTPLLARSATDAFQLPNVAEQQQVKQLNSRPSLPSRVSTKVADLVSTKPVCDIKGPCFGYSDPCGQDCFQKVNLRGGLRGAFLFPGEPKPLLRSSNIRNHHLPRDLETGATSEPRFARDSNAVDFQIRLQGGQRCESPSSSSDESSCTAKCSSSSTPSKHHHHVAANAFLAISLQTSIAIALHKLPEGFITYATNHANPHLGLSIFVALFIHNLTEGFALALPIFLASGSRTRALALSSLLGGASQPLGAGVAAAWLAIAEKSRGGSGAESGISEGVYGAMFALTAGIMASVGLSLLREGLELGHNKGACIVWTFVGMGILGISGALTA